LLGHGIALLDYMGYATKKNPFFKYYPHPMDQTPLSLIKKVSI
jgi:hypothetical protein